ncbi:hypothetical protein M3152_00585 [Sporosarcina luteola]|uniref:hypothetical protein n=1 Tax=Bacillales TaxID=1385 RepID=UPI00203E51E3|nr:MULTISPECIES: hypothetical protein [Bacillales]MCM3636196.1 hypothetical protein [Sporosarcina luteola]
MEKQIQSLFDDLEGEDKDKQYSAFMAIMEKLEFKVDWAYEVWDILLAWLTDKDNHRRARAAQFLAGLAISDPEQRILRDFPLLLKVTKDEKFVTARHCLQSIWKVGLAGKAHKELVMGHLVSRFQTCSDERHPTLIRYDIQQGFRQLYDATKDQSIKKTALELIEIEEDEKYVKKYKLVWK